MKSAYKVICSTAFLIGVRSSDSHCHWLYCNSVCGLVSF